MAVRRHRGRGDDRECIETALRTGRTRPVLQGPSVFRALCGGEPLVDRIVAVRRGRLAELAAFGRGHFLAGAHVQGVIVSVAVFEDTADFDAA